MVQSSVSVFTVLCSFQNLYSTLQHANSYSLPHFLGLHINHTKLMSWSETRREFLCSFWGLIVLAAFCQYSDPQIPSDCVITNSDLCFLHPVKLKSGAGLYFPGLLFGKWLSEKPVNVRLSLSSSFSQESQTALWDSFPVPTNCFLHFRSFSQFLLYPQQEFKSIPSYSVVVSTSHYILETHFLEEKKLFYFSMYFQLDNRIFQLFFEFCGLFYKLFP